MPRFVSPYPGLRPFQQEEAALFFGREEQTDAMLSRLEDHRFLAVVGASGSGKSSLVRAGLLPALEQGLLSNAEAASWRFVVLRPGNAPFRGLIAALLQAAEKATAASAVAPAYLEATLRGGPRGLVEALRLLGFGERHHVLVLVDQFEEIFRSRQQRPQSARVEAERRDAAAEFVGLLLASARQTERQVHVVITMRSEFVGHCEVFHGLPEAVSESQFLVPRLTREQMREAIERPLGLFGATAEPDMVNRILNDAGTEPDLLPLMQHALMRAWDQATASRRSTAENSRVVLTLQHYLDVGGMAEALSRHAEAAFAELRTPGRQMLAQRLFQCLSDRDPAGPLIRRLTTVDEVRRVAQVSPAEVLEVVNVFQEAGRNFIVTSTNPERPEETGLDVSHEALLRQWDRVQGWVEQEAESAAIFRRLLDTARRRRRGAAGWLRNPELAVALRWQEARQPTTDWARRYDPAGVDEALEFLERSRRRNRQELAVAIAAFAVIVAVLALLSLASWILKGRAEAKATEAENAAKEAGLQQRRAEKALVVATNSLEAAEVSQRLAERERIQAQTNLLVAEERRVANEDLLVRSLVRTIGAGGYTFRRSEYDALWDLASLKLADYEIRRKFGRAILADAEDLGQISYRLDYTIHALVGLQPLISREATRWLIEAYSRAPAGEPHAMLLAEVLARWFLIAPAEDQQRLAEVLKTDPEPQRRIALAQGLARAGPGASADGVTNIAQSLLAFYQSGLDLRQRAALARYLAPFAANAPAETATAITLVLAADLAQHTNVNSSTEWERRELASAVGMASPHASPEVAAVAIKTLLNGGRGDGWGHFAGPLAEALRSAGTTEATLVVDALLPRFEREADEMARAVLVDPLCLAVARADPGTRNRVLGPLVQSLSRVVELPAGGFSVKALGLLGSVAPPTEARLVASNLVTRLALAATDGEQSLWITALYSAAANTNQEAAAAVAGLLLPLFRSPADASETLPNTLVAQFRPAKEATRRIRLAAPLARSGARAPIPVARQVLTNLAEVAMSGSDYQQQTEVRAAMKVFLSECSVEALNPLLEVISAVPRGDQAEAQRWSLASALQEGLPSPLASVNAAFARAILTMAQTGLGDESPWAWLDLLGLAAGAADAKTASAATDYALGLLASNPQPYLREPLIRLAGRTAGRASEAEASRVVKALLEPELLEGVNPRQSMALAEALERLTPYAARATADVLAPTLLDWMRQDALADSYSYAVSSNHASTAINLAARASPPFPQQCLELVLGTYKWSSVPLSRKSLAAAAARLEVPELIELLKYPTSVREIRLALLDALEQKTGRTFGGDLWAFVAFAQQQGWDTSSPPTRPTNSPPQAVDPPR